MKKYNVYSVGTALVDYQFLITEFLAKQLSLEHGGTLINLEQEEKLLQKLSVLTPVKNCGGSGANTLSVISQLGGKTFYTCKISDDEAGKLFQENLNQNEIESELILEQKMPTGKCLIMVMPNAERILNTFLGANSCLSPNDLKSDVIHHSEYIFIEAFSSAVSESSKLAAQEAMEIAKQAGTKIALTLSTCRPLFISQENFVKTAGTGVDLLFCNRSEAEFFCGSSQLEIILQKLTSIAKQFVITLGGEGVLIYDGSKYTSLPAYKAQAIDTTGAGDVFAGAFLFSITHGKSFLQAADFACFASAKCVEQIGARLSPNVIAHLKSQIK